MTKYLVLVAFLAGACVAQTGDPQPSVETSASTGVLDNPQPQPQPQPPTPVPNIVELAWHWTSCGPSATALPFGLVVDVSLDDPASDAYKIKGQATGCDPFDASGQLRTCAPIDALARSLTVTANDGVTAGDTVTITISDCVDGKATFQDPDKP